MSAESLAGMKLKTQSGWENDGNGFDEYGFAVSPGGYHNGQGEFLYVGYSAYFWAAAHGISFVNAYLANFTPGPYVYISHVPQGNHYTVRLIKDS